MALHHGKDTHGVIVVTGARDQKHSELCHRMCCCPPAADALTLEEHIAFRIQAMKGIAKSRLQEMLGSGGVGRGLYGA